MGNGNALAIYMEHGEKDVSCDTREAAENDYVLSTPSFYKDILDNCREFIYRRCLSKDEFDYISPYFGELTGFSPAEYQSFKKDDFFELIHPEDRSLIEETKNSSFSSIGARITQTIEYRIRKKDGSYVLVSDRTTVLKDKHGNPDFVIGNARNITEERAAKEALQESEEQFSTFMENLPNCCVFIKGGGADEPLYVNKCLMEVFGQRNGWLQQQSEDFITAFEKECAVVDKKVLEGAIHDYVVELPDMHGQVRTYRSIKFPLYRKGKPTLLGGIGIDVTEQVHAVQELKKREKKYRSLFENSKEMILICDPDGRIIDMNQVTEDILGYSKEEIKMLSLEELHGSPAKRAVFFEKMAAHGYVLDFEEELYRKDGTRIDCSMTVVEIKNDEGAVEEYQGIIRDITERKQAEERLREQKEQYRSIFESTLDGLVVYNLDGYVVHANAAAHKIFGYSAGEMDGIAVRNLVAPGDRERHDKRVIMHNVPPYKQPIEVLSVKKDDSAIFVEMKGVEFEYRGQQHALGIFRDITDRKLAAERLRASEAQYSGIFNAATDGFFVFDLKGNIKEVNHQACRLFGYTRDEFLGLPGIKLVHPDYHHLFEQFMTVVQKGDEFKVESVEARKDGSFFDAEVSGTTFDFHGEKHLLAVVRDITERKSLEKQLTQAQKMEAIGTLAGGIAHDFNNLLMAIQGHISLMQLHIDSTHPHVRHFDGIEEMVRRGAGLTQQFLAFARGGKYEVTPTDVNELIGKTVDLFGRTKKELLFHEKYQEHICTADIDRGQIEQVIMNLLVNAWQAMPEGGTIYIQTEETVLNESDVMPYGVSPGKYVTVAVTDTGLGMDEETKQRIFEPFFTTKKIGKGTGLGLASTYGIIKNHGGFVSVDSEPGVGTTFAVYLPASEKKAPCEERMQAQVFRGAETILFVDDEEMVVEVGKGLLTALGYDVLTAESGQEALSILEQHQEEIDLIILDMIMPGMSGGELHDGIKQLNPQVKTLLSSGYSIDGQAADIMDRGCNGFLQKPFKPDQLSRKIREILEGN